MIAKNAEEAAKQTRDVVGRMATEKLVRDTYEPNHFSENVDLPEKPPKNPKVYVALKDFAFAHITGPIRFRRGQEISDPAMIKALKASNAAIKPLR